MKGPPRCCRRGAASSFFSPYGVGSQVSVSMFTRVALIVPLITGPAGVLPFGIKLVIVNLPV